MIKFYLNTYRFAKSSILIFGLLVLFSVNSQNIFAQVPQITSFSPASGPIGTVVTISGSNFSSTAASNIVYFGAVRAFVTTATSTSLTVTCPSGATYQPITVTTSGLTTYSAKPFVVTSFASTTQIVSNTFGTMSSKATGKRPHSIACGDFNEDGKIDLVTANYDDNTISIHTNTSSTTNISFANKIDLACGSGAFGVTTGDVTGDGMLDIAVANYFAGTVSVYKNTSVEGYISFDSKVDYYSGSGPRIVSIGDLDGDGKADLAVANDDGDNISIFRNTGTNNTVGFATKVNYSPGDAPRDVVIGDLNADGKPELVVANFSSHNIAIYKNNCTSGNISFSYNNQYSAGPSPRCIGIGDLDNDGKPDVAVTNYDGSSVSIFLNGSASGNIAFNSKSDFSTESSPYGITVGDVNGDGKLDLAVANLQAQTMSVLKNTTTNAIVSFAARVDYPAEWGTIGTVMADFNQDNRPDFAAANDFVSTVSILKNQAESTLPLDLASFKAKASHNFTSIEWVTNNETGTLNFILEHATDNVNFREIARIDAAGNSIQEKKYTFRHTDPSEGSNYYRLRSVNSDGTFTYSSIEQVNLTLSTSNYSLYPNPTDKQFVNVKHESAKNPSRIKIVDVTGKTLQEVETDKNASETKVSLIGIAPGIYTVVLSNEQETLVQKLIVQ